jgi:hypothetical protein
MHLGTIIISLLALSTFFAFGMAVTANVKHTWTPRIQGYSGTAYDSPVVINGNGGVLFNVVIPAGETAEVDDAPVTVAKIKSCFITSTQAADVNTNAADGAGGQTFSLLANRAVSWHEGMLTDCPFTPDVTKWFIKNNGAVPATVIGEFVLADA